MSHVGGCIVCGEPALSVYQPAESRLSVAYCTAAVCQYSAILAAERWLAIGVSLQRLWYVPHYELPRGTLKTGIKRCKPARTTRTLDRGTPFHRRALEKHRRPSKLSSGVER
jgi:hypothetical protein